MIPGFRTRKPAVMVSAVIFYSVFFLFVFGTYSDMKRHININADLWALLIISLLGILLFWKTGEFKTASSPRNNPVRKNIVSLYCLSVLFISTYVPWNISPIQDSSSKKPIDTPVVASSYDFIWNPPQGKKQQAHSIDLKRLSVEFIGITVIAGVLFWQSTKNNGGEK